METKNQITKEIFKELEKIMDLGGNSYEWYFVNKEKYNDLKKRLLI